MAGKREPSVANDSPVEGKQKQPGDGSAGPVLGAL